MKIGVDGGGTKTECILVDDSGEVVQRHLSPGCNPSLVGPEKAREALVNALRELLASHNALAPVSHTLLCMAGSASFWRDTGASLRSFGDVETATDALPVLELATGGEPGLALHAGTGSFVILRASDGSVHYAGGLGWRIGDSGSAHDIGRRALARALAELQGWAEPSAIGSLVAQEFSTHDATEITTQLYHDAEPNRRITCLSGLLPPLAVAGNAVALGLILDSTRELLRCAVAAATRHLPDRNLSNIRAGLCGSILTQPFVSEVLAAEAPFRLDIVTEPPIEGVRRLLARK